MDDLILINNGDSYSFQYIGNLEGFEFPSTRPVIEDISGPQSSIYITSKFGRRRLSFQAVLMGDVMAKRRTLLLVGRQGNLKTLKFTTCDNLQLQTDVEIEKILMPYNMDRRTIVLIEAVAPDWRFYSQALKSNESTAAEQTVTNAGNETTDPVIRINGPFTSATITNLTTGESFVITHTVTAGHYIEIDTKNRTVKYDGDTSVFTSLAGEFISMVPSANVFRFVRTGGGVGTSLRITWRDAFLGI